MRINATESLYRFFLTKVEIGTGKPFEKWESTDSAANVGSAHLAVQADSCINNIYAVDELPVGQCADRSAAQIGFAYARVMTQLVGGAFEHNLSVFEHVAARRHRQRDPGILLNQ